MQDFVVRDTIIEDITALESQFNLSNEMKPGNPKWILLGTNEKFHLQR